MKALLRGKANVTKIQNSIIKWIQSIACPFVPQKGLRRLPTKKSNLSRVVKLENLPHYILRHAPI